MESLKYNALLYIHAASSSRNLINFLFSLNGKAITLLEIHHLCDKNANVQNTVHIFVFCLN